ncbi:MAG: branched-chain amino acid aminotransferase [Flavobacteriaceae bacterium]|jgi:branched-chain amino acid aminotransferase|uniref:aminotransferase class IV n=1 Tax=Candidatus Marifrigoribacter sp. Uisw_064 TaxID=3230970 RepID=UPI003AE78313
MINFNGEIVKHSEENMLVNNRGLQYGDAVFETIKFSAGKILFWEDHYFRLMSSMRILRLEIPMNFTMEYLEEKIRSLIQTSSDTNQTFRIKILVWRKAGGKYTPTTNEVDFCISFETIDASFYMLNEENYEVDLFKDHYINSGLLSTIKTNSKLIHVLGSIYAKENDLQNCLILNENKQVVEALNGNIFLVKGNHIKTPPLKDGCLKGIIRKQLISILVQISNYTFEEVSISPFELQKADEIFITNVIVGIQPITKYRKKEFDNKVAKDILAKLNVKARLG